MVEPGFLYTFLDKGFQAVCVPAQEILCEAGDIFHKCRINLLAFLTRLCSLDAVLRASEEMPALTVNSR